MRHEVYTPCIHGMPAFGLFLHLTLLEAAYCALIIYSGVLWCELAWSRTMHIAIRVTPLVIGLTDPM